MSEDDWDPEIEEFMENVEPGEPSERDVWASANMLVTRFGPDACIHAAMSADKFLAARDLGGYRVWKRILAAVDQLLTLAPPPGTRIN